MFSWIAISFVLKLWLTLKAVADFSDLCVANVVAIFYLVVSSSCMH